MASVTDDRAGASDKQVPITLTTSQQTLSIPSVPYLVPTSWRRSQLSSLVNRLLKNDSNEETASIPFDFIIDGELLRTSLSSYLQGKGLTEETAIEIEYVRSTLPPKFSAAFEHDDWISGVDASREGLFLTSSYDGTLRIFGVSTADKALTVFRPSDSAPLTSTCWLHSEESSSQQVAAVGMDGILRICSLGLSDSDEVNSAVQSSGGLDATETPMPLSSVSADERSGLLLTAGWDGCVALWKPNEVERDSSGSSVKRRKRQAGASINEVSSSSISPLALLWHTPPVAGFERTPGTNSKVTAALWSSSAVGISSGWDGSVRSWDVTQGNCITHKTSDKVILCADKLQDSSHELVVTGHMDRSAGLWDLRTSTTNISSSFHNAHSGPISTIRRHPLSSHLFATGSHDGFVKVWDTRSPRAALFALAGPTSSPASAARLQGARKLLALDWDKQGQTIVAGGEDCQLSVHRGHGIGQENFDSLS